ncbi:MAG: aminotransferase class V-fold PLP-dependent enzyme [Pirellulales bacterium]
MDRPARIYLDNAATSWPKPEAVYQAVDRYQREVGAAAGRGAYVESLEAARIVAEARRRAARLLGAEYPHRVIFTSSGTDGLNLALHGVLRPGDHMVSSVLEHNSVLRPLEHLAAECEVSVTRVPCGSSGRVDPDDVRQAFRKNTALVAITHASNVTGLVQPVAEIGRLAHERGALLLVDAAQTLGHFPFSVDELHADLLAAPGHKGLLGPLGTGLLYVRPGVEARLRPTRQGGTGSESELLHQPDLLPDRYEPGNHNLPGLAGLNAALAWIEERGLASIAEHEAALRTQAVAGLAEPDGVALYGAGVNHAEHAPTPAAVGVLSLNVRGYDPQELAAVLDAVYGVQTRAGLHCAPLAHDALGTLASGGALRLSWGSFTTPEEIGVAVDAIAASAGG